jgi:hypothetical protein
VRGQAQFLYQNGVDFVTRRVIGVHGNARSPGRRRDVDRSILCPCTLSYRDALADGRCLGCRAARYRPGATCQSRGGPSLTVPAAR